MATSSKPELHLDIPSMTISLPPPSAAALNTPPFACSYANGSPPLSPDSPSRQHLMYTITMLPDHVLSPSTWELYTSSREKSCPTTFCYRVPETNVAVEVTGY